MRALAIGFVLSACAFAQVEHQHHPPGSATEYAKVLEDPGRDAWQKPHEVIEALEIKPDEVIADIGAGSGYFSRRFARHAGKVYAVDIDAKLLEIAAKDAPPNLATVEALPDDPKLPAETIDTVFFCDVLHHIGVAGHGPDAIQTSQSRTARMAYYAKLRKALKPGGRIVIVEFFPQALPVGPGPAMKLAEKQVVEELEEAGFRVAKRHEALLPYQWFVEFTRPSVGNP
jgi:arsenite methyltransferase